MRFALTFSASCVVVAAVFATAGCEIIDKTLGQQQDDASAATAAATTADAGATADAGIVGGGCGVETNTGMTLCVATSMCPTLVVDTQAMPHCGFRISGAKVDLVCGCGSSICPMGVFTTCTEAAQLLATQSEQGVCVQITEERCIETGSAIPPTSSSSASSSGGGNPACNQQCMKDCGGGSACASVCNCD